MRIAFYAPMKPPDHPNPSGDRRMARLLCDAMKMAGHDVHLVSRFRSHEPTGNAALQEKLARDGAMEAQRVIDEIGEKPDLFFTYHVYHKAPDYIGPLVSRHFAIPYVIAEPSVARKQAAGPWRIGYEAANAAIGKADALICVTRHDMALVGDFAADRSRLHFLPPFLDTAPFIAARQRRMENRKRLAAQCGIRSGTCWLIAVGMMRNGAKAASYLALAKALGRSTSSNWSLLIVGDGEARAAIEAAFSDLRGRDIHWLGQLPEQELAETVAAADLFVWPAVDEAYGMAMLEAGAAGIPVVSVAHRGVPDVVRDKETGWLIPAWHEQAFVRSVDELVGDADRRMRLGANAAEQAAGLRSVSAAARALDDIFARL